MALETQRLLLREFTWDDFEAVYAYESDPFVVRYVCYGPFTKAECRRDLAFHIDQQTAQPRTHHHLAVVLWETNHVVGWCGLKLAGQEPDTGELGYALHRDYWGWGLMTEAARAMLAFGFETLHLQRIVGMCHPHNHGSIRVMEKLGMRYEGRLRKNKWCRGQWRDTMIYAMRAEERQSLNLDDASYP